MNQTANEIEGSLPSSDVPDSTSEPGSKGMAISLPSFKLGWPRRDPPTTDSAFLGARAGGPRVSRLPLIGHMPLDRQLGILAIGVLLFLLAGMILSWLSAKRTEDVDSYVNMATRMQFLTQRIAKGAEQAALGNVSAFDQLKQSSDEFNAALNNLIDGGTIEGRTVSAAPAGVQPVLKEVKGAWDIAQKDVGQIMAGRDDLVTLQRNVSRVGSQSNELGAMSEELSGLLLQTGTGINQIAHANRLSVMAQRMARSAQEILTARTVDPEIAFQFSKDTDTFRDIVEGFRNGSTTLDIQAVRDREARSKVDEIAATFAKFQTSAAEVSQKTQRVAQAKTSSGSLFGATETLLSGVTKSLSTFREQRGSDAFFISALVCFVLAFVCLALIANLYLVDARQRAESSEREMKRNQEAILRLLNEMGDLADGDLTVHAQVTEDITGAIADSMNYTVEELRTLVLGVNNASTQVTEKSQEARDVATQLLDAARRQSHEIEEANAQVTDVVRSINTVSASASESALVAQRSLAAAEQGQSAVQNAIQGMHEMREQIQETSKRIKRLGESSQMIGEIVELIGDITEQTNVLALNAAIQAAAAGEAGRGFSVVAEEVQRLAERSTEATKQIAAIVKTIQADTHDAAVAMEKSIEGVVANTRLSDNAGQALTEIGQVSKQLADLIQSISAATQSQVAATDRVAKNMEDILHITRQATEGTQRTADSVGQLSELAQELKNSVAGFKLD
jgi:twitching motility protein PilJ